MILDAVKQNTLQNMYVGESTQSQTNGKTICFLDHFQEATEKITSGDKILLDHRDEDEQECEYFSMAQDGVISYKGAVFVCDYGRNELQLGDCSDRSKCLTIPLTNGGSLVVNRDNIIELKDAISMFSPEDQLLIMKAIIMDKRAQEVLREIEEESFSIGAESYTVKEWDKLIERFDRVEDVIKKQVEEDIEKRKEEEEKKEQLLEDEEEEDLILGIL